MTALVKGPLARSPQANGARSAVHLEAMRPTTTVASVACRGSLFQAPPRYHGIQHPQRQRLQQQWRPPHQRRWSTRWRSTPTAAAVESGRGGDGGTCACIRGERSGGHTDEGTASRQNTNHQMSRHRVVRHSTAATRSAPHPVDAVIDHELQHVRHVRFVRLVRATIHQAHRPSAASAASVPRTSGVCQ